MRLRCQYIVPLVSTSCVVDSGYEVHGDRGLTAHWRFPDRSELVLITNLGPDSISGLTPPNSQAIFLSEQVNTDTVNLTTLPPWSLGWFLRA